MMILKNCLVWFLTHIIKFEDKYLRLIVLILIAYFIYKIISRYLRSAMSSSSASGRYESHNNSQPSAHKEEKKYVIEDKDIVDAHFEEIKEKKTSE